MDYQCLIIDDEKMLADSTAEYFSIFGVSSAVVYSSKEAQDFFKTNMTQLVLLDINLGDGSGFELCKELRKSISVPILFISARASDDDKIIALNIGGDDYIQKPVSLGVLLAKVRAVLKRQGAIEESEYWDGRLKVNFKSKQVIVEGVEKKLTSLEYRLLSYLIKNRGNVVSKSDLFDNVWKDKFTGDGTLNVHIRRLRELIEFDANHPEHIVTVWREGYKFKEKQS